MIPIGVIAAARTAAGGGGSAHRYWRWVAFTIPGAYFEVGELRVVNGSTRLSATMSTGTTPATGAGTEANLADDSLDTRAYWTQADAQAGGFWVMADLGTAQVVTGMQIGSFDTTDRFPSAVTLQWSDNASDWTTFGSWSGMTYPGYKTWGPVLDGTIVPFDIQSDSITNATPIQIDGEWVIRRYDGTSYQAEPAGSVVTVGDTRGVGYITDGNAYSANINGTEISVYSNLDTYLGYVRRKVPGQDPVETNILTEVYPADSVSGERVATVWGFEYDDVMYLFAWEYIYPDLNGPYLYSTTDGLSAVKIKEQDFNGSGGTSITRVGEYLFAISGSDVSRVAIADVLNPSANATWSVCSTGLTAANGVGTVRGYGTGVIATELNGPGVAVSVDSGATWVSYSAVSYGGFAMPVSAAVTGSAAMVLLTDGSVMATPLPSVSWTRNTPTGLPANPEAVYMPIVGTTAAFVAVPNGATLFSVDGLAWSTTPPT